MPSGVAADDIYDRYDVALHCCLSLASHANQLMHAMTPYQLKQSALRAMRGCASMITSDSLPTNIGYGLDELAKATANLAKIIHHDDEEPIFLFATGWRTGSTLMQRVLVTDPNLLLWGEPHGRMGIMNRLGDMVASFDQRIAPDDVVLKAKVDMKLSGEWIANLYPRTSVIREALQSMVYEWLGRPAKELGYKRWGMKEVRLGHEDAALLRWLFPKAKFVVITRNPHDSYRSAMQLGPLWERWPDRLVNDAYAYGRLWNRLALSWKDAAADFPVRRYRLEDLTGAGVDFDDLASFCRLELNPEAAIGKKVGAGRSDAKLSWVDGMLLRRATAPGRSWLGY